MRILESESRSLREYRLLPGCSRAGAESIELGTRLCRSEDGFLELASPFASAAMQAVTGSEMAIAMAQLGGIGVLPLGQSIASQCEAVAKVKRFKAGFQTDIHTLAPQQRLAEVAAIMEQTGYGTFPVTDNGIFHGRLLGVLTEKDFDLRRDLELSVAERMKKEVQVGVEVEDLDTANRLMIEHGRGFLPIVSQEGTLVSVVFKRDRDKHLHHPGESVDRDRRLRVAAAVSTHPEDRARLHALLDHEVDVLVIDASNGHTRFQAELLAQIKACSDVPVIAGNVVTAEGFEFLAAAGADAVKVGMGIGSGCITQGVKATGRGQATALREIAAARARHLEASGRYLPLIADGGLRGPGDMMIALALGADCLMLGNLLARFSESPGALVRGAAGALFKEYWMEGSVRAANARRYEQTHRHFFEEGIDGLVPHDGSVYEGLPRFERALRSAIATAGCCDIPDLQGSAVLERQSSASLEDAAVHGVVARES